MPPSETCTEMRVAGQSRGEAKQGCYLRLESSLNLVPEGGGEQEWHHQGVLPCSKMAGLLYPMEVSRWLLIFPRRRK